MHHACKKCRTAIPAGLSRCPVCRSPVEGQTPDPSFGKSWWQRFTARSALGTAVLFVLGLVGKFVDALPKDAPVQAPVSVKAEEEGRAVPGPIRSEADFLKLQTESDKTIEAFGVEDRQGIGIHQKAGVIDKADGIKPD